MSNPVPAAPPAEEPVPERFVPDAMRGQLVAAEHVARYTWASAFCSGRRVLDAGCGAGYGSELLNGAGASEVVAVDSSEAALQLAPRRRLAGGDLRAGRRRPAALSR